MFAAHLKNKHDEVTKLWYRLLKAVHNTWHNMLVHINNIFIIIEEVLLGYENL